MDALLIRPKTTTAFVGVSQDMCGGLQEPPLHCHSSGAAEDGFPWQGAQIEMLPALPKASIEVPLLLPTVLITWATHPRLWSGDEAKERGKGDGEE